MIPAYVSALSAVLLLFHYAIVHFKKSGVAPGSVSDYGRKTILTYNVARLASVLALLALSIVISIQDEWPDINAVECAAYVRLVFVSYPNTPAY